MTDGVNDSAFYMWRTLVAVAHADNIVTDEEIEFIARVMEDVDFSDAQTETLKDDIVNAKDVNDMFAGIKNQQDRIQFFDFARDLVWVDGDFASEEQSVMIELYQQHIKETDVDGLIGQTHLEFEEDFIPTRKQPVPDKKTGFRNIFSSLGQLLANSNKD